MDGIKALTFDTGGTILDWHSRLSAVLTQFGAKHHLERDWASITNDYRRRSITKMLDSVHPEFNIDDVHREMLDAIVSDYDLHSFTSDDRDRIWTTWHQLDAWPDFPEALASLRKKYTVVSFTILSLGLRDLVRDDRNLQDQTGVVSNGSPMAGPCASRNHDGCVPQLRPDGRSPGRIPERLRP